MPADIDPNARPDQPARCPRRLLDEPTAPRCLALVLAGDADEHEQWHDVLDGTLEHALRVADDVTVTGFPVASWPDRVPGNAAAAAADL